MHDIQTEDKHVKLETLFDAHLSAHQNPEPMAKAPVDSYVELTNAIVERDDAFKKIPVFKNENIAFLLAPFIIGGHYYLWNKWLFHNDWLALGLLGTLFLVPLSLIYFSFGVGIGALTNKFRRKLWKSKKNNQSFVANHQSLVQKVEQLSNAHESLCKAHLSEKLYFQYMFNFDQMVERITQHSVYTESFYEHTFYTSRINLPEMRENLKQAYLGDNSTEFFYLYYQALELEETAAKAWVKFEAQDGEILEEKYQAFARTQTGQLELQDII